MDKTEKVIKSKIETENLVIDLEVIKKEKNTEHYLNILFMNKGLTITLFGEMEIKELQTALNLLLGKYEETH